MAIMHSYTCSSTAAGLQRGVPRSRHMDTSGLLCRGMQLAEAPAQCCTLACRGGSFPWEVQLEGGSREHGWGHLAQEGKPLAEVLGPAPYQRHGLGVQGAVHNILQGNRRCEWGPLPSRLCTSPQHTEELGSCRSACSSKLCPAGPVSKLAACRGSTGSSSAGCASVGWLHLLQLQTSTQQCSASTPACSPYRSCTSGCQSCLSHNRIPAELDCTELHRILCKVEPTTMPSPTSSRAVLFVSGAVCTAPTSAKVA